VDLDLDGDLDLVEATGHVYRPTDGHPALRGVAVAQRPNVLENDGQGHFSPVPPLTSGALARRATRGLAVADLDDDGRPDLVLAPALGRPLVFRNRQTGGHFLRVRLQGRAPNTGAIGARVTVAQRDVEL